ncbi:MAG TPA: YoaK family protein [bacterium]|nr:YoaK family protein [bacterium]
MRTDLVTMEPLPGPPVAILLALTFVTGVLDALAYLALGRVFTANITGNMVLLGFAAGGAQGLSILRPAVAVVAFIAGALWGGRLFFRMKASPLSRWAGSAFGMESALFLAATIAAAGHGSEIAADTPRMEIIALTAIAMGIRNATIRKLGVPDITTTLLTLSVTGLAVDSRIVGGTRTRWARRTASVVAMLVGAAAGAWLLRSSVALPLALCTAISALCAVAAYFRPLRFAQAALPDREPAESQAL